MAALGLIKEVVTLTVNTGHSHENPEVCTKKFE